MKTLKYDGVTYEGYTIDSKGNVFNPKKQKLKPWDNGRGYLIVDVMKDKEPARVKIHLASAETYLGKKPSKKMVVHHKDSNKKNNGYKNLEYISQQDNVADAQEAIKGKEYLTDKKLAKIKDMIKAGESIKDISDKMKLKYHIVRDIKYGKTYK